MRRNGVASHRLASEWRCKAIQFGEPPRISYDQLAWFLLSTTSRKGGMGEENTEVFSSFYILDSICMPKGGSYDLH